MLHSRRANATHLPLERVAVRPSSVAFGPNSFFSLVVVGIVPLLPPCNRMHTRDWKRAFITMPRIPIENDLEKNDMPQIRAHNDLTALGECTALCP